MSDRKASTKEQKERKERFTTPSGIVVDRLYTQKSLAGWDAESEVGYPGEFPYTRGIYPSMYRGRVWTMRQYAGFGSAAESNQRYRYLLSKGQSGLSVAFDLPTQIGMDSDHTLALGEVGKVGVAIDSLEDMERLFEGIPLEKVSTSMTINSTAAILLALYVAVAKKQGANLAKLSPAVCPQTVSPCPPANRSPRPPCPLLPAPACDPNPFQSASANQTPRKGRFALCLTSIGSAGSIPPPNQTRHIAAWSIPAHDTSRDKFRACTETPRDTPLRSRHPNPPGSSGYTVGPRRSRTAL